MSCWRNWTKQINRGPTFAMRDAIAILAVLFLDLFGFIAVYPTQSWDTLGWLVAYR
jgi:hypothetical protein